MKALWLEPGRAPVTMTLENDRVAVREGSFHGHYHMYTNGAQGEQHLMLAFGEETKPPFRMKHVGSNEYKKKLQQVSDPGFPKHGQECSRARIPGSRF